MTDSSNSKHWLSEQKQLAKSPLRRLKLLAPLTGLLIVAQAWLLAHVIDAVIFAKADLQQVMPQMLALLPLFAARFLVGWQAERQAFHAAALIKQTIRMRLFDKLRALGPVRLADHDSGSLATSLVDGVESLEPYFARYLPALTMMSMVPLIILLAVVPSDWLSGVVLLVTAPLVPLFMGLIGKGAERLNQQQWQKLTRMGAHFLNVIQTLPTLKMFNASRRELHNIARISDEFRRSTMSVLRVAFLTSAVLEFFAALSIALIAVFIGFRLLDGEMAFFYGFFVLLLAPEFYMPLRNYGVQNHARMEAAGAAEQIVSVLDSESAEARQQLDVSFSGALQLQHLHFAYEPGRPALAGFDLRIEPGQHIAIVGPSGSGKSTLANLLLGFEFADSGEIRIGDTPLAANNIDAWRRHISWIPQKPRLFHGSVADNIRLGAPQASLNAVLNAAEAAHALEFIDQLPAGLDTVIGEGGLGLSGGQAQRIALARALVRDTPYLLLDEPTAHLDAESEQAITDALQRHARGRTVISIAHRLHTVREADLVVVMRHGRIVQQGHYEQLAGMPGAFAELLRDGREVTA